MKLPLSIYTTEQFLDFELFGNPTELAEGQSLEIEEGARIVYEAPVMAKGGELANIANQLISIYIEYKDEINGAIAVIGYLWDKLSKKEGATIVINNITIVVCSDKNEFINKSRQAIENHSDEHKK